MKKKIKCRITSRNNIIFIKPMVTRFTQIIRSLSLTEVGICLSSGAIVEELDAEGKVIRNLNLNNYKESFATSDENNISVSTTVKDDESPIIEEAVSDEQPTEMEPTLDQSDNESSTTDEKEDEPEEDLDELQDDPYDNYNPPEDTE